MNLTRIAVLALPLALVACEKPQAGKPAAPAAPKAAVVLPTSLFLAAEPKDAKPVEDAKKGSAAGQPVVIRGRIGGSGEPFVENRAMFTIMGPGLKACSDNPGDECKTPWDYCCEQSDDIAAHMATVRIAGPDGAPLKTSVKGEHGLKELSDVIIVGKIAQAEGSVLVVDASGIFIAKP